LHGGRSRRRFESARGLYQVSAQWLVLVPAAASRDTERAMSQENVETVRRATDAFNRGDRDAPTSVTAYAPATSAPATSAKARAREGLAPGIMRVADQPVRDPPGRSPLRRELHRSFAPPH
jgi:hypothetical protein